MEINPQKIDEALRRGNFFGFIPHRLESAIKPELNKFPFNVMFMSWTIKDGKKISGTALYEPDFHTFKKEGSFNSMRYHNIYGGDCHLTIAYGEEKKEYRGEKFINGKSVVTAYGGDNWQQFFVQLTMLGLAVGERCMFDEGK